MNKGIRLIKRLMALFLVLIFSIESLAAVVSDNDGSAFITKAEFDSLKNNFQSQIDQYNTSIDSKIDGAIASYLAGISVDKETEVPINAEFKGRTWKMINSDSLSIADTARVKPTTLYKLSRTCRPDDLNAGTTSSSSPRVYLSGAWASPEQSSGRELCARKRGSIVVLDGYYTDFSLKLDFTGYSYGGMTFSAANLATATWALKPKFEVGNGSLVTPITSFALSLDYTSSDGPSGSAGTGASAATGVYLAEYSTKENFLTLAFNNFNIKVLPLNWDAGASPIRPGGTINVTGTNQANWVITRGTVRSNPITMSSYAWEYWVPGCYTIGTSNIIHQQYENYIKNTTSIDKSLVLTAGARFLSPTVSGNAKCKINSSQSLNISISDTNFLEGFAIDSSKGSYIPINDVDYSASGYITLTKEQLLSLTFGVKKDKIYYFKWNATDGTTTTSITFPESVTVIESDE